MHAIIAFGKDLLQRCYEYLQILAACKVPKTVEAQEWLKKHHINANVTYLVILLTLLIYLYFFDIIRQGPVNGKWSIKACHTWELILNWEDWTSTICLKNATYSRLVAQMKCLFDVCYMWHFVTEEQVQEKHYFRDNVRTFIAEVSYFC